jgi:Fur family ferric uptake transcriptional regulator
MDKSHKDFFKSHSIKSTSQRNLFLDLLQGIKSPSSAEEIYVTAAALQPTVNLSTIYRILDLFESKNIVTKNMLSESKKALYELNTHTHKHYMVCMKCKRILPLENCPCSLIENAVSQNSDFQIVNHKLEITGYCPNCKQ